MYSPPAFREDRPEVLHTLIRQYPLATLVTHGPDGLSANLIPFLIDEVRGVLLAHLARANPQISDLRLGGDALVMFQGPQAYISPSWYASKAEHGKVVPTWNYVTVQVHGQPQVIDNPDWLRSQIDALTVSQEQDRPDPWAVEDAPADFITSQIKGIVGLEIPITRIEGKWKMSQNRSEPDRDGVAAGLALDGALAAAGLVRD